jgi:hypothetical protein
MGECCGQQRGRGLEPFVVAGLLGQVGEQVAQSAVGEPYPAVLAVYAEQDLGHGQGQQLGVAESGTTSPTPACRNHMIVDLHIQCGQEGVEVVRHSRSLTPSSHARGDRHARFTESII